MGRPPEPDLPHPASDEGRNISADGNGSILQPSSRKIAGCAIPLFSIRSEGSCGTGDFGDLKSFIDWAADTGQQAVQLLPINDTSGNGGWMDSYPYSAISIYAFHPMYIDLRQLPEPEDKEEAQLLKQKDAS